MATDYGKKKNAELEELLKARSLPHTGKKAELIARLQQSDKDKAAPSPSAQPSTTTLAEDEIDWDDDAVVPEPPSMKTSETSIPAKAASTPAAADAIAAGGKGQAPNPTAVPNQIPTNEPFKADHTTLKQPGETTAKTTDTSVPTTSDEKNTTTTAAAKSTTEEAKEPARPPPTDYTANIPATTLEEEIQKRKKRAAKWGTGTSGAEAETEAEKLRKRAEKFGTGDATPSIVKGLDEALPERNKKRGRGDNDDGGRGGKRARRGGSQARDGVRSRSRNTQGGNKEGKKAGAVPAVTNGDAKAKAEQREKDRLAAEKRKAKWGT